MAGGQRTTVKTNRRLYHVTPTLFFVALLAVQVSFFLSDRFRWFGFQKGWTVLFAVGVLELTVAVILLWGLVCLRLRWRFQFSLRSFLVLMVTSAVPLGWVAWELKQARRQRDAVEAIEGRGGTVLYKYELREPYCHIQRAPTWLMDLLGEDFFHDPYCCCIRQGFDDDTIDNLKWLPKLESVNFSGAPVTDSGVAILPHVWKAPRLLALGNTLVTDAGLEHVGGLTGLRILLLSETEIGDAGLEHLTRLRNLRHLELDNTRITNAGLEHLTKLPNLGSLALRNTQITDGGLEQLAKLAELYHLDLGNTQISDAGLEHLTRLRNLLTLELDNTRITDAGLEHLAKMKQLDSLVLVGTEVTDEGIRRFLLAVPYCYVTYRKDRSSVRGCTLYGVGCKVGSRSPGRGRRGAGGAGSSAGPCLHS